MRLLGRAAVAPMAAGTPSPGRLIVTSSELEEALRTGDVSDAGIAVSPEKAMRLAAVYACVRIIAGAIATLPLDLYERKDKETRLPVDGPASHLVRRRPNRWQTPAQFRRTLQSHVLLRGNAYALIVRSRGEIRETIPLDPDRVTIRQTDALKMEFDYARAGGARETFRQEEILHLAGLSLDGIRGVSPIAYARETLGLALAQERHGAVQFRNGLTSGGSLSTEKALGPEGRANLRASLDEFRASGDMAGKWMILEDGLKAESLSLTAADAQWIEGRKLSRSDIAMFFGVPPHMIGDTEKSTSWGTGIEQQSIGFVAYTLEDHLTMWEQALNRDLLGGGEDEKRYFRFNRAGLVRGDIKTRWEAHVKALQWGVMSPNEVRSLEDMNPREGGDLFYPPPNTAGGGEAGNFENTGENDEENDEPAQAV